jgi:hypothetical protein
VETYVEVVYPVCAGNRVQKVLEDANIKLAMVATDVMGVSGRTMLEALLSQDKSPEEMADLAKGRLRNKLEDLTEALRGRVRPHHILWLKKMLAHVDFLRQDIRTIRILALSSGDSPPVRVSNGQRLQ